VIDAGLLVLPPTRLLLSAAYHFQVRRLFIMLMIALLPLRGWAGDLMSVQMATGGLAPQVASAMPPGCPMHTQADAARADGAASHTSVSATENCTCCDLCVPMAELSGARLEPVGFAAHAKPLTGGIEFRSASPARAVEPPIS
jgi:hypothetical protein